MAYAKICDRCSGVYAKNDYQESFGPTKYGTIKGACVMFEKDEDYYRKHHYMDLCDTCSKMLVKFLTDKDVFI